MIDRDRIRRYLFETYGVRVDNHDPMMIAVLINEALWVQMAEVLGLMVQGMEPTLEGIYDRAGQESKALGTEVIVEGAREGARAISQSVRGSTQEWTQEANRVVQHLQSTHSTMQNTMTDILDRMRTYYDAMFKMYAFMNYLSAALGALLAGGLCTFYAWLKGWI
jgi:hypothetical protein